MKIVAPITIILTLAVPGRTAGCTAQPSATADGNTAPAATGTSLFLKKPMTDINAAFTEKTGIEYTFAGA